MIKFILGWFGYAKVDHETYELARWLHSKALATKADPAIIDGLAVLERWLKSCRGLLR